MAGRRANGEGTIYRRKDGRYEGAAYFRTISGKRKRVRIYGRTREQVHSRLVGARARAQQGIPTPDNVPRLDEYLDSWLATVVRPHRRPKTYEQYECTTRLYLKPALGTTRLDRLAVAQVQDFLNTQLDNGSSVRKVQIMRTVLSSALARAVRQELVSRNVARLVDLPIWRRGDIKPWTAEEARQFLAGARSHPLYVAFLLLILCGLRRGEVLGLRWADVDFEANALRIRQQLQRVGTQLLVSPVKTDAGRRDLPLVSIVRQALLMHWASTRPGAEVDAPHHDALVFTTSSLRPIEPRNFVRTFWTICARQGVRVIKLHHLRHTTATLLKQLGVDARDAQLILGHSQISVTQQVYQHDDMPSRRATIERVEALLCGEDKGMSVRESRRCRQMQPSRASDVVYVTSFLSGGSGGTRTHDTLLKRSTHTRLGDRVTSVTLVLEACRRQWILGCVAVNLAVRHCLCRAFSDASGRATP
jgi:integrase